jgi:hypothetical protein
MIHEERAFRIHRLKRTGSIRFLRLRIDQVQGTHPVVREVGNLNTPTLHDSNPSSPLPPCLSRSCSLPSADTCIK